MGCGGPLAITVVVPGIKGTCGSHWAEAEQIWVWSENG